MVLETEFPEKLSFLLDSPARLKILYGGRGAGKCLGLGTKVIMFDGSLKAVEDVITGDLLMGPDSEPREVLGTTRGSDVMYKISQTSAIDYVVNSDHILSLKKSESAKNDVGGILRSGNARRPFGRYPDYEDICNINVVEAFNKSKRWQEHFRGYRAGLIEFEEKNIAIDPWYLGLWLGDGKSTDCIIYSADDEILEECEKLAFELGMRVTIYKQPNNQSIGIKIARLENGRGSGKFNLLWDEFKEYNLANNKHIPFDYLTNSEEIRLQVLAGLLDSDGHLSNNGYHIVQTNEVLAKQIKYLADSLGFRTYFKKRKTVCSNNGVEGIAFGISINGDTWRIPCRLPRKKVHEENVRKNKDFLLSQISIECVGEGEYAGFSLDGDHLFLLEDGTVTHNTENIARALIIFACSATLRIACFREIQDSIQESVHQTIKNQIYDMGLDEEFDITDKTIISKRTGSEFIFKGIRYNINSIKSLARIDIAWVEEAVNVSKTSWEKLGPTIRGRHESDPNGMGGPFKKGPEIWISFNPELETDETYKRFVVKRDTYAPDFIVNADGTKERYAFVVKLNWSDNKWFPPDLRRDMELLRVTNRQEWLHVWEGNTKQTIDGAIYAAEIEKVLLEGRRGKVQYDPSRPVHTFWDLGWNDLTSIWFVQQVGVYYNLINYYQNRLQKIPHYLEHMQGLGYVYGIHNLPHDGDNETLAARSTAKMIRDVYPGKVRIIPRVAKKDFGIKAARVIFDLCNFDEENTSEGWQALCHYQYGIKENGDWTREPKHDPNSNGADGFQTLALSLKSETAVKKPSKEPEVINFRPSQNGWMS